MKNTPWFRTGSICVAVLVAAGCSTKYEGAHSGYLPENDYNIVKEETAPTGGDRYIWLSDKFTPANYHALIVDPLEFYPKPEPNEYVTAPVLQQISDYATNEFRTKIGAAVQLTDTPGPGVAHLRMAFTAAGAETRSLKFYQYVPIGLVITGIVAAAQGGLPKDSTIAFESEVVDSVSKETLAVVIRGGTGERVEKNEQGQHELKLDDLKPLIDAWTTSGAEQITKYIKAK